MSIDDLRLFVYRLENALDKVEQDKCMIVMKIILGVLFLTAGLSLAIFHLNDLSVLLTTIACLYSPAYTITYYVKLVKYYKETKWLL